MKYLIKKIVKGFELFLPYLYKYEKCINNLTARDYINQKNNDNYIKMLIGGSILIILTNILFRISKSLLVI